MSEEGRAVTLKQRAVRISKYLSLVLRHEPSAAGVSLDAEGWVAVDELLAGAARHGLAFTRAELDEVVRASEKQRFAFSADAQRIRASQGHSVTVDLGLVPVPPPPVLYHGTIEAFLPSILAVGLERRARQHVHLSADVATASRVGGRRGRPVILRIAAADMHAAGFSFFRSANGVWLTDEVPARYLSRSEAKETVTLGEQTRAVVSAGEYVAPSGRVVVIREAVARAISESVDVPPAASVPRESRGSCATRFSVVDETTLVAARRMREPLALNFASAKNPGGGWLGGARAQEESLARQSALVAAIEGKPMYAFHRSESDCLYTSWAIVSPHVPVIRDEAGVLLEAPWLCSFLTCAAPNATVVLERDPSRGAELEAALAERVTRVLGIAAQHGFRELVLGAWGCGVFGNDPEHVARHFDDALRGPFAGAFEAVVFAIIGEGRARRNREPFAHRFGNG
jgi:uncharacterized protein (TIGR02452 family)